jgi:hypothetical protein
MRGFWVAVVGAALAIACDGELTTAPIDAGLGFDGGIGGAAGTGGGGAAGAGAGAGGMPVTCTTFTFLSPQDGATLSEADDTDHECQIGFAMDVQIATNAAENSSVLLTVGDQERSAQVHGAVVEFFDVPMALGFNTLVAQQQTGELEPGCSPSTVSVQVSCTSAATCQIISPVITPMHPLLNGVLAPGGDRASPLELPYRTPFDVQTGASDGELVTLEVDGLSNAAVASVVGGIAHFPGVELTPEGDHQIMAECRSGEARVRSSPLFVTVDSVAPDLTVTTPLAGEHFGPDSDADPSTFGVTDIDVCMETESADALDLPSSLGVGRQQNFCVRVGEQPATCAEAMFSAADNACVRFTCPGNTPLAITAELWDRAGNVTSTTVPDVTCSWAKPVVQITSPLSGTQAAQATHLLAANHTQVLRDRRTSLPGAQWTVRACTDTLSGSAVLLGGSAGSALSVLAGPVSLVSALAGDNCPTGLFGVARFVDATVPESEERLNGNLDIMTELRVEVTDALLEVGQSEPVTLWVDSFPPSLSIFSSVRCGDLVRTGASSEAVTFQFASAYPVSASLLPPIGPLQEKQFPVKGAGLTDDDTFDLEQGENLLIATSSEPSGNEAELQSSCIIELGDPPIVTWTAPASDALFNVATDDNTSVAGWQGDLSVTVTNLDLSTESPPLTVEFFRNEVSLGVVAANTVTGVATLSGVTIDDGEDVELKAVTSLSSKGIGHANLRQGNSIQLLVDTIAPDAPTNATFSLVNRRQTSFRFRWTAPADGGAQVGGYQVRVHTAAIDDTNFDDLALSKVSFSGNTGLPGTPNIGVNVNNRLIERDYYAAVVATDAAGNRSPIVTAGPAAGHFNVSVLPAQHNGEGFGMALDGGLSLNDDDRADLVVGTEYGNRVYLWLAAASGDVAYSGAPSLVITGPTNVGFGNYAVAAGDLNADGLQDLVVGAPFDNPWGSGLVYVFLQPNSGWPSALNAAAANATIAGNPADSDFDLAFTGGSLARLGDFDGDGVDDVAMGLPYWGPDAFTGYVAVLRGSDDLSGALSLPDDVGISGSHRLTAILGENGLQSGFSTPLVGIGQFYPDSGNSLVVAGWQGDPSRVYAIAGSIGNSNGVLQASAANHTAQSSEGAFGKTLALLGVVGGNTGIAVGQPKYSGVAGAQGRVNLYWGNANTGPFANVVTLDNANTIGGDLFGTVIIGSAISGGTDAGSTIQGSFLGPANPDVALAGSREQGGAPIVYFLEGQTVQSLLGQTVDIVTVADAALDLSDVTGLSGWKGTSPGATPVADVNGDGFMDLAIGEHDPLFATTFNGRVVVIW